MNLGHYCFSRDVADALNSNSPILAMESTILTHGLPHPENHQFLQKAVELVRSFGVAPATIAVINGASRTTSRTRKRCWPRVTILLLPSSDV